MADTSPNVGVYAGPRVLWADDVLTRPGIVSTHRQWLERFVLKGMREQGFDAPQFDAPRVDEPMAAALVWRNTWVARCPLADCAAGNSYEGIWRPVDGVADFFFCCSCGNRETGGRLLDVGYMLDAESVESILHARPNAENRNWEPGETLDDLRRENAAHGLPARAEGA